MSANNHIYTIYKATNILNGKGYVGFAAHWPIRKLKHQSISRCRKYKNYFYNAIRKYGWDNFQWDILYQSYDGKHCFEIMEPFFISEHQTHISKFGYNMTKGGGGTLGWKPSIKTKNKIRQKALGRIAWNKGIPNPIARERMLRNNPMKNPKISKKVREKLLGKIPWNKGLHVTNIN